MAGELNGNYIYESKYLNRKFEYRSNDARIGEIQILLFSEIKNSATLHFISPSLLYMKSRTAFQTVPRIFSGSQEILTSCDRKCLKAS